MSIPLTAHPRPIFGEGIKRWQSRVKRAQPASTPPVSHRYPLLQTLVISLNSCPLLPKTAMRYPEFGLVGAWTGREAFIVFLTLSFIQGPSPRVTARQS